ncbi:MAG: urate hydroxylase PuuD [bacterium]
MLPHIIEWLNLTFRWLHVIVGVAWIGASFYFVWLENNLERLKAELPEDIAGDLWAIHGGGFYYLRKFKVAPKELPKHLHWFKWEAYMTWVTGICLLIIVYYMNASTYMVDTNVANISPATSIGIGVGALVVGWGFYDILCRTPLLKKPAIFLVVMFAFLTACAYGLQQYLSPRAAYIHIGAMIGTMMAGNVFFVIIPGQKKLVAAAEAGREPDPWDGIYGGLRSRHNNYFTLPVLFIMTSNHFPMTYGNEWGWAILAALSAVGVAVRHHFNVRHRTNSAFWVMPVGVLVVAGLAWFTAPAGTGGEQYEKLANFRTVSFQEAQTVVSTRCWSCHSSTPTDDVFKVAPNGVIFDTPEGMQKYAGRMKVRAYDLKTMPMANKTQITDEERLILGAWVFQGAKIE